MAWTAEDRANWYRRQEVKRSYWDVRDKIERLRSTFETSQYGALTIDPERYPLFLLKSKNFAPSRKTILITGGVHGYETSGVHGALAFMERAAASYDDRFNFVCTPCISPWAYETINRWNPEAIDPNRSFYEGSPAEECRLFFSAMAGIAPFAHFDLHETTNTDATIFRPELAQRDGIAEDTSEIPDGFYLVGDADNPQPVFQKAIIDAVRKVTHIAPADADGNIIGDPLEQPGVILYALKRLHLCAGFSDAEYTTTTEVYPDSPRMTDAICIEAQVTAIRGGLDFLIES